MMPTVTCVLVLALLICALCAAPERCSYYSRRCKSSSECCSGCCSLGLCAKPDHCSDVIHRACDVFDCPPDKECYMGVIQCANDFCPPIPACRPKNLDDYVYE